VYVDEQVFPIILNYSDKKSTKKFAMSINVSQPEAD
jgi:hypothetical protein